MAKTFHLTVARVGENLFDDEVISLTVPGKEGVFQVLADHEPLVSELTAGEIHVTTADNQSYHFEIPVSGIAEVSRNQATILV